MKFIFFILICLFFHAACNNFDDECIKDKIYKEWGYTLVNFTVISSEASGFQFQDYDEEFEIKLDSFAFDDLLQKVDKGNHLPRIGDSLILYDRTINELEFVSIQMNRNQKTLTYSYTSE